MPPVPGLAITPTFNSLELEYGLLDRPRRVTPARVPEPPPSDPVVRALGVPTARYEVLCPDLPSDLRPLRVRLFAGCERAFPPVGLSLGALVEAVKSRSPKVLFEGASAAGAGSCDETVPELVLSASEPSAGFHLLDAARRYIVVVSLADQEPEEGGDSAALRPGDVVGLDAASAGRVVAAGGGLQLESVSESGVGVSALPSGAARRVLARGAALCFLVRTQRGHPALEADILRSMVMPRDRLGEWLLGLPEDYAYAASLQKDFVVRLLEHGLFVLPGDSEIFSCPLPLTPYLFYLQSPGDAPLDGRDQTSAVGRKAHPWRKSKMLRRYRGEFEMSCNANFAAHFRLCGKYHHDRGGTWICDGLIALLEDIDRDTSNGIRMYCFELWDKSTGNLAAASFGFSLGRFFHDFSMCCPSRDRRTAGSVLTKAVGDVLTRCGVDVWYWGCKMAYMAEYDAHGGHEVPREEYYQRIRRAAAQPLASDPAELIRRGHCEVAPRQGALLPQRPS